MIIKTDQLHQLSLALRADYVASVRKILLERFAEYRPYVDVDDADLVPFIQRCINGAQRVRITAEDSVTAFIVLSYLNGEHFLQKPEFALYKRNFVHRLYDPNKYIFEVPSKNPLDR